MVHVYISMANYGRWGGGCWRGQTQGAIFFINIGIYYKWISLRGVRLHSVEISGSSYDWAHEKGMLGSESALGELTFSCIYLSNGSSYGSRLY